MLTTRPLSRSNDLVPQRSCQPAPRCLRHAALHALCRLHNAALQACGSQERYECKECEQWYKGESRGEDD